MSSPLIRRKIGNALVPPIGFGAMGISAAYGPVGSDEERFKVLDAAYEQGCTHWDTADVYGDSEQLIGKWFKRTGKRNDIFLATKFGITLTGIRGDPDYIRQQVEKSLQNLGVETIDLYYAHRIDPKTPIEVTVGILAELVKEGKIKNIVSPFVLDIFDRKLELLTTARELGVTIVSYAPLGRGLLTGKYKSLDDFDKTDYRRIIPKYSPENFPKILDVIKQLEEIGSKHNATSGQVSLAWVLAQGDDFVTIPGTKKIKYLEENLSAVKVKLSPEEVDAITTIAKNAEIPGDRYDALMNATLYVNSPEPTV
ncbi:Aldo-keto reductase yakc [NADP(+)] [Hypsizygus marmoreus]|uniref:Aldo-keto reductase yakc [NADP(+)] n=1 Tax=Hypsizygus marmoreus TaxID=39966 RepID=A0A369JJA0_HYPMA|nr:Aldo-keto reductase yakc [NADP(+)] [Hypsizygus marmoreus]